MAGAAIVLGGWWLAWPILMGFIFRPIRFMTWQIFGRLSSSVVDGDIVSRTPNSGNSDDTKLVRYRFSDSKGRIHIARTSIAYTATLRFNPDDKVSVTYCGYDPNLNFLTGFGKEAILSSLGRLTGAAIVAGILVSFWPQIDTLMAGQDIVDSVSFLKAIAGLKT